MTKKPKEELYRVRKTRSYGGPNSREYVTEKTYTNLKSAKNNMKDDTDELLIYKLSNSQTQKSMDRDKSIEAIMEGFPNKTQTTVIELLGVVAVDSKYSNWSKKRSKKICNNEELKKWVLYYKEKLLRDQCCSIGDYESVLKVHAFRYIPKRYKGASWKSGKYTPGIEVFVRPEQTENFKKAKNNIKKNEVLKNNDKS